MYPVFSQTNTGQTCSLSAHSPTHGTRGLGWLLSCSRVSKESQRDEIGFLYILYVKTVVWTRGLSVAHYWTRATRAHSLTLVHEVAMLPPSDGDGHKSPYLKICFS